MKSVLKYSVLFIMFVCTLLITMDLQSVDTRKQEVIDAMEISMRNVLTAKGIHTMYDMEEKDMEIELIRQLAQNVNTNSDITVNIVGIDTAGLLDVQVVSSFQHLNGRSGQRSIRRTKLIEEYPI